MYELTATLLDLVNQLESLLINNDTDNRQTREKIRGRVEDLKQAIAKISGYTRLYQE